MNTSNFFVSELNYQVGYAFFQLEIMNILVSNYFDLPKYFFLFVEALNVDVIMLLFCLTTISVMTSEALKYVNNKITRRIFF